MTVTYTIDRKNVTGNVRENIGHLTYDSGDSIAYVPTGLRYAYFFEVEHLLSGLEAQAVYPLAYPAEVNTSGRVTVVLASAASGVVIWRTVGVI